MIIITAICPECGNEPQDDVCEECGYDGTRLGWVIQTQEWATKENKDDTQ